MQIALTTVDTPSSLDWSPPSEAAAATRRQDDLAALKSAASKAGAVLHVASYLSLTAPDGLQGVTSTRTEIPYFPLQGDVRAKGGGVKYVHLDDSLTAVPRLNADGTVTIDLTARETVLVGPPWRELSPPATRSYVCQAKLTVHNGDTVLLTEALPKGLPHHLYFLTVTIPTNRKA